MSALKVNFERLNRFFDNCEQKAFREDLRPMGALFVKDNEVIVLVDNEVSDKQFIECCEALVKEYHNPTKH